MRKTKILATLGPVSSDVKTIRSLLAAGMNAIRINASHASADEFVEKVNIVRKVKDIPIVLDTQGPEVRLLCRSRIGVKKGTEITLGKKSEIKFNKNIYRHLKKNDIILVNEGLIRLAVKSTGNDQVTLLSMSEGDISNRARVNIPDVALGLDILTNEDRAMIKKASSMKIDYIALSYTRNTDDIRKVRRLIGKDIGLIAKIETPIGIKNFDSILEEADGIMVARGDLGVEIPSERVPLIQKELVMKCNQAGKLVIIATQMLQSMIENSTPTRAETSDVANAILDGCDVIMLSAETAIGKYPVKAVREMHKIALETESIVETKVLIDNCRTVSEGISKCIHNITNMLPVTKIITLTRSGYTARIISRFKLNIPIIAITKEDSVRKKLELHYGVTPVAYPDMPSEKKTLNCSRLLFKKKLINRDDLLLFTAGVFSTESGSTNLIEIHKARDLERML
ncbi:pyruvate kinase [Candidatus Woesearchaeota archaeon]|nr:pyruvate kinase [Candidatus Woesearchaeota archaeon]